MTDHDTLASHSLAIAVIHNGDTYDKACNYAKYHTTGRAQAFANLAANKAFQMGIHFGDKFTAKQILLAAVELEEYYTDHVNEGGA